MSRDILPLFEDGKTPEPTARAVSEVFLQPDAFRVGMEDRSPDWNAEDLIGLSSLYLGPPIPGGVPGERFTRVDPAKRFDERWDDAVTMFLMGYYSQLAPLKSALEGIIDPKSQETLRRLSSELLHVVDSSVLKTVVTVAVTGTLERPVAELAVPRKVGMDLGVFIRDKMIVDPSSVEVAEELRPKIMTQHPIVQNLGVLAAANLMPLNFV